MGILLNKAILTYSTSITGLICCIILIGFLQYAYAGSGAYSLGTGSRVLGRGGADIAVANDAFSITLNPAGMLQIDGRRFDLSLVAGVGTNHFDNDYNDDVAGDPFYFFIPNFGYVNNSPDSRWAYGITLYSPGGLGSSYKLYQPLYEKELVHEDAIMPIRLSPAVAYRLTSKFTVGFAPCFSYTRLDLKMPFTVSKEKVREICQGEIGGNFGSLTYGEVLNWVDVDEYVTKVETKEIDDFAFGFTFGMLYKVNSQLSIGFSYMSKQKFDLEGSFQLDANRQLTALKEIDPRVGLVEQELPDKGAKGYSGNWDTTARFVYPQKIGIGISYKPWQNWHFAFDALWVEWSDFLGSWEMKQKNGDNRDLNAIIGDTSFSADVYQIWKDSYIFSIGIEYEYSEQTVLRGGVAHSTNIVPSHTIDPTGPVIAKDHATLGWGYSRSTYEFNVSYEHIFRNSSSRVSHHEVTRNYDNAKTTLSVDIICLTYTWKF